MTCERSYTTAMIAELQQIARRSTLAEFYRHVGRQIASLPASEHLGELVAMMQVFQAQGVDVAGLVDCLVEAMREE